MSKSEVALKASLLSQKTLFVLKKHSIKNQFLKLLIQLRFIKTNINESNIHKTWTDFTAKIVKKDNIRIANKLTKLLVDFYILITKTSMNELPLAFKNRNNGRLIFTIMTIGLFPSIACQNDVKTKDHLINLSKTIVTILDNIELSKNTTLDLFKLSYAFINVIEIFNNWKQLDKEYTIYLLAKDYLLIELKEHKLLETKNSIENNNNNKNNDTHNDKHNEITIFIDEFKKEKNQMKQHVAKLFPNEVSLFKDLVNEVNHYDKIQKHLYWLDVEYNLDKDDFNKQTIVELFSETKRLLVNLVPRNIELITEINEMLDEEMIANVVNDESSDNLDLNFYYNKCYYILALLHKLQSSAMDAKLETFKNEFEKKITDNIYLKDLIPLFFRFVLDSLEQIHKDKNDFLDFKNHK